MNVFKEWPQTLGPNDMHLAVVFIEVFGVYFGYSRSDALFLGIMELVESEKQSPTWETNTPTRQDTGTLSGATT
nr:hypothetical protein CFP56_72881 [Quercus suber]